MSMAPAVALDKNKKSKKVQIFEAHLRKHIIGQPEAIEKLTEMYQLMVSRRHVEHRTGDAGRYRALQAGRWRD